MEIRWFRVKCLGSRASLYETFVLLQGAARRLNAQRKTVEIESIATAGKQDSQKGNIKKYFQLEVPLTFSFLYSSHYKGYCSSNVFTAG